MKRIICLLGLLLSFASNATPQKIISQDQLDNGIVALDGQWAFDWRDLHQNFNKPMTDGLNLPGLWHQQGPYSADGFATLRLRVRLPNKQGYFLRIPDAPSALQLWANDQLVFQRGQVGQNPSQEIPQFGPDVIALPASQTYDLIMLVSNFHHKEGGVWHNLFIADGEHRHALREQSKLIDAMIFMLLILVSVYLLLVNLPRKRKLTHILFALFIWAIAFRSVMVGERIAYDFITQLSWLTWQRLEHILLFVALPLFIYFFHRFFDIKHLLFAHSVALISVLLIALTLYYPVAIFSQFSIIAQGMGLFTIVYVLAILLVLFIRKKPYVPIFAISFLGWGAMILHDYLYTHLIIQSRPLAQFGLVFFVLFQFYLLWQRKKSDVKMITYVKSAIEQAQQNSKIQFLKKQGVKEEARAEIRSWVDDIRPYCKLLNLPIRLKNSEGQFYAEPELIQRIVLLLARFFEQEGLEAALTIRKQANKWQFEFLVNGAVNVHSAMNDKLNVVHLLLDELNESLLTQRKGNKTYLAFQIDCLEKSEEQTEIHTVEYYGNEQANPILLNGPISKLIQQSLGQDYYLIHAPITKRNVQKFRPKIIIWDVQQWHAYDLEMMRNIRQTCHGVPILLMVKQYDKAQLAQCIRIGIADYIVAPILQEELLLKVQRLQMIKQDLPVAPIKEDMRDVAVQLIRNSVDFWQKYSGKSKVELAEGSRMWRVYMDGSTAKTRTLDKYLSLQSLPKNPRWDSVMRTAHFVQEQCRLDEADSRVLNEQLELLKRLLAI